MNEIDDGIFEHMKLEDMWRRKSRHGIQSLQKKAQFILKIRASRENRLAELEAEAKKQKLLSAEESRKKAELLRILGDKRRHEVGRLRDKISITDDTIERSDIEAQIAAIYAQYELNVEKLYMSNDSGVGLDKDRSKGFLSRFVNKATTPTPTPSPSPSPSATRIPTQAAIPMQENGGRVGVWNAISKKAKRIISLFRRRV